MPPRNRPEPKRFRERDNHPAFFWSRDQLAHMDNVFCARMTEAIEAGRERMPRKTKQMENDHA